MEMNEVCTSESIDGSRDVWSSKSSDSSSADHLVVMVNGILGSSTDWKFASEQFVEELPDKVFVHCSERNVSKLTLDGVDVMGERLTEEVIEVIRRKQNMRKVSFIAHSVGGLVARYAVGKLYRPPENEPLQDLNNKGSMVDSIGTICGLEAVNFITVATPHLGSRGNKQMVRVFSSYWAGSIDDRKSTSGNVFSFGSGAVTRSSKKQETVALSSSEAEYVAVSAAARQALWLRKLLVDLDLEQKEATEIFCDNEKRYRVVPFLFGVTAFEKLASGIIHWIFRRTGRHLFLTDDDEGKPPLLKRMVEDYDGCYFMSALRTFKRRVIYSNVGYDHIVGWRTSSIRRDNELPKWEDTLNEKYPHVVYEEHCKACDTEPCDLTEDIGSDKIEEELVTGLSCVSWEKVDVSFHSSRQRFAAHSVIQVKDRISHIEGADVIHHMIDHFLT